MVHLLHSIDIPIHPNLQISYVPSLCYIDEHKNVEMLEGVTDLSKIKEFYYSKLKMNKNKARGA